MKNIFRSNELSIDLDYYKKLIQNEMKLQFEKQKLKFLKQIYAKIKKYSKRSKINNEKFSQEIIKHIWENSKEISISYNFINYSFFRQIEFLILSIGGRKTNVVETIKNDT